MTAALATRQTFDALRREDEVGEWWSAVPGYEDTYDVSSWGRVRSWSTHRGMAAPHLLKPFRDSGGYMTVGLKSRTRSVQRTVHGLVALAFIGPRPEGQEVRHLEGDQSNNALTNLTYGTRVENRHDIVRHGRDFWANKTHCPKGHPYDDANTYFDGKSRKCRACHRLRMARRRRTP